MAMTLEQSLQWQANRESAYIAALRASLGDSANDQTIEAMALLYRAGWNDCFAAARLHGVERLL